MMATDISELGFERLICTVLTGHPCDPLQDSRVVEVHPDRGGVGWRGGNPHDYDREFCVDRIQLAAFLRATQPETAESLALDEESLDAAQVLGPVAGRDLQARYHRCDA